MPSPTSSQVHINRLMTNFSVAYMQESRKFAALRVFPGVNVSHKSDKYAIYSQADFLRDEMTERAPATESGGTGWSYSDDQYLCTRYATHVDIDNDTIANQDAPLNVTRNTGQFLGQKAMIRLEVMFGSEFFTTGVWTGSSTGTDLVGGTDFVAWDDVTSDPLGLVDDQKLAIESVTGYLPNKLTLNRRGWYALRNHPDIVDRIKHTSAASITPAMVAQLMELDEIIIAAGVRNSAARGLAGSYGYIFGNHALLTYSPASVTTESVTAGMTFRWTGLPGSTDGQAISEFDLPLAKARRFEIELNVDMKVVAPTLGAFMSGVAS